MRGRLIFPFIAEVFRLDAEAMAQSRGYDLDFKEPIGIDTNNDGIGELVRREHPPVRLPCQVEPKTFEEQRVLAAGHSPRARIELIFHFRDLERRALIDIDTGAPLIRPIDRLGALYDKSGNLVQHVRTPPGLYMTEVRPMGFGLNRAHSQRNLLFVVFEDRQQAARRFV
ncbi:MAG: hypothetical protein AAFV29_26960 [Myxococcota bacterium]